VDIADDVSAIPKYVGGQSGSGAGRTASGLAMLMGNASKILQTVSANIDRDVIEGSLLQLQDLLLLTDKTGLLSGDEKLTVQGVSVAIQRETLRQRQIEFLTATNNPTDLKIMGVKGRATVLRSVSTTIGMPGEEIVPSEDEIEKMMKEEKKQQEKGSIDAAVQKAVTVGVESGVKKITSQLTEGALAARAQMPDGYPDRPGMQQQNPGGENQTNNPEMDLGNQQQSSPHPSGSMAHGAAQAQGSKPSALSNSMGPQTHLTGSQPGKGAKPVSGGVG
jgi:hypothetical protein